MRTLLLLATLATLALLASPPAARAAQLAGSAWPLYRHDVAHTGRSPAAADPAPELHWSFPIPGSSQTGVMVGPRGDLYFGTNNGEVVSLTRAGELRWRFATQGPIRSAPCLTQDDRLYFGSFDGCLYALRTRSGLLDWTYCVGEQISSPPVVDRHGRVFFGCTDGYLRCLDPEGELLWAYDVGRSITAGAPTLDSRGSLYTGGYTDEGLLKLRAGDGSLVWSVAAQGAPRNTPALHPNGNIYIGTRGGVFYCVAPWGEILWQVDHGAEIRSSAAISPNGNVIIGTFDGKIHAHDPATGAILWSTRIAVAIEGSPVVDAADRIYAGGTGSSFTALDADGEILYLFGLDVTDGVVSIDGDGRLYAASETRIAAYGARRPRVDIYAEPRQAIPNQTVTISLVIENGAESAWRVDQRTWIAGPDEDPASIERTNDRILGAGSRDSTVVAKIKVPPDGPLGAYRAGARLLEPETGRRLAEAVARFDVVETAAQRATGASPAPGSAAWR